MAAGDAPGPAQGEPLVRPTASDAATAVRSWFSDWVITRAGGTWQARLADMLPWETGARPRVEAGDLAGLARGLIDWYSDRGLSLPAVPAHNLERVQRGMGLILPGQYVEGLLEAAYEEEQFAYDGSNVPQKRMLEPVERSLLHRVIAVVTADPRWETEQVVRRPEIREAIGDGTLPQARDLTARERDDVSRMVTLLTGELHHQDRLGHGWPPDDMRAEAQITRGDIARLNLIAGIIDPRHDGPDRVVVNVADWAPPVDIPRGWQVVCAPRPLQGSLTWEGDELGHGHYYAAANLRALEGDIDSLGWIASDDGVDAWPVYVASNEDMKVVAAHWLARFRCPPNEAGVTLAEVARDLGLPMRDSRRPAGAQKATSSAPGSSASHVLRGADRVAQRPGQTRQSAESGLSTGMTPLPEPNFYPADGPRYASRDTSVGSRPRLPARHRPERGQELNR